MRPLGGAAPTQYGEAPRLPLRLRARCVRLHSLLEGWGLVPCFVPSGLRAEEPELSWLWDSGPPLGTHSQSFGWRSGRETARRMRAAAEEKVKRLSSCCPGRSCGASTDLPVAAAAAAAAVAAVALLVADHQTLLVADRSPPADLKGTRKETQTFCVICLWNKIKASVYRPLETLTMSTVFHAG